MSIGFKHRLDGEIEASAHGKPTFSSAIMVIFREWLNYGVHRGNMRNENIVSPLYI